jgi:hypothetical protein
MHPEPSTSTICPFSNLHQQHGPTSQQSQAIQYNSTAPHHIQQLQYDYNEQLEALEHRFEQKMRENTVAMSNNIVETLGKTIKDTLLIHSKNANSVTTSNTSTSDLLDLSSNHSMTSSHNRTHNLHKSNHQSIAKTKVDLPPPINDVNVATHDHHQHDPPPQWIHHLKSEVKLHYQTFKPTSDYEQWKAQCILKTKMHDKYQGMVTTNYNDELEFDVNMSVKLSSMLFMITLESLGQEAQKLYGSIDMKKPNGIKLWKLLDKHYLHIDTSLTNQEILADEFASIKREQNEDYTTFGI